jgi:hypothetical protein
MAEGDHGKSNSLDPSGAGALAPGGGSPLGPAGPLSVPVSRDDGIINRPVRAAIERAKRTVVEHEQAMDNPPLPRPPPMPEPPPSTAGLPMHFRDRWLFILLAWSASPTAVVVAGIVAFSQSYPHWGAGLVFFSLLGMTAVTLHLLEKKPKALPRPGPIVVGVATVTWAFVGCMAWVQIRTPVKGPTAEEIAAAVVKILPRTAEPSNEPTIAVAVGTTIGNLTIPYGDRIIEQPTIDWDGKGPIVFRARVDRAIEKQPIYLDWGQVGPGANYVLNNGMMGNPRVEIGFIERLAPGQTFSITIGQVTAVDGQQQILQWGETRYDNTKVGVTSAAYMARVVLLRKDGKEEQYPFLIVPRTLGAPPTTRPGRSREGCGQAVSLYVSFVSGA